MFTVIIPLFNKAHTIIGTIESVLEQDFQEFEIVVVDDGSTDNGAEKIAAHFTDPRIRLIKQAQSGAGVARNRGVATAMHDLVAFLDADDLWLPDFLTTMKRAIEEFPRAGLYCAGGVSRNPDGSGYMRSSSRFGGKTQAVDFFSNPVFFANCSSIVVVKSTLQSVGGFPTDVDYGEDQILFYKLAIAGRVVFCPAVLTIYERGVEGQATAGDPARDYVATVKRVSAVYDLWAGSNQRVRNRNFIRIARRDLRRSILEFIRMRDYRLVRYFFEAVDERLLARLTTFEKLMYQSPRLRLPAVLWIYACELGWRATRPPRLRHSKYLDRCLDTPLPAPRLEVR